ncbi:hypothetical protein [Streptomyces sp. MS2.AVA.5]|uniref:Uncharacterized protein n=1 Tax=Streptomyces achmelvichensis TaxID=3134111 RepID=A0ACC6Q8B4_9ACTN
MPTLEIDVLLDAATDEERPAILRVAYKAGLLWQCLNPSCGLDERLRSDHRCPDCGFDRDGRPIGDSVSASYGPVPDELLTALRESLVEWFTERGRPLPDAVSFAYTDTYESHDWSDWGSLHFGGRTEPYCSFDDSGVGEALIELTGFEAPRWNDQLTIALPG